MRGVVAEAGAAAKVVVAEAGATVGREVEEMVADPAVGVVEAAVTMKVAFKNFRREW
jgi:hypothetical protein